MTYKEKEQRREREMELAILTHSIAKQAAAGENVTYSEVIQILNNAKAIVVRNMEKQRAEVPPEVRDTWGAVIEVSGTEVPDSHDISR